MTEPKPHLLVVDDEPLNRDLLRRVLHSSYEVTEAADASDAIEVLESEVGASIGLVLCDHLMPGMSGVELAVIAGERWPKIAFILVTGYDADEDVRRVQNEGLVFDVLPKPWRSNALREAIAKGFASLG